MEANMMLLSKNPNRLQRAEQGDEEEEEGEKMTRGSSELKAVGGVSQDGMLPAGLIPRGTRIERGEFPSRMCYPYSYSWDGLSGANGFKE